MIDALETILLLVFAILIIHVCFAIDAFINKPK
jgi:hypothetical protein